MTLNSWFKCFQPRPGAQMNLFCFPYAGAGASLFRDWPAALPGSVELHAAQLPGRENRLREPAIARLSPLVEHLATAMAPYLTRPFALFGQSMGALVSFAVARQLRHIGSPPPGLLMVCAHQAPQFPRTWANCHLLSAPKLLGELRRLAG